MNSKPSCSHELSILMGEDSQLEEICEDCLEKILNQRSILHSIFKNEGTYQLSFEKTHEIDWQINLLETVSSRNQLPTHLSEYVTSNLVTNQSKTGSIVVKLFKKGLQLLESYIPMKGFSWEMVPMPQVRNGVVGESFKLIDNSCDITYNLMGESHRSLYLSVRLENSQNKFDELSVRKNNRLIHSQKIDNSGILGVSGLVSGDYLITLSGIDSKQLKIQILDE